MCGTFLKVKSKPTGGQSADGFNFLAFLKDESGFQGTTAHDDKRNLYFAHILEVGRGLATELIIYALRLAKCLRLCPPDRLR